MAKYINFVRYYAENKFTTFMQILLKKFSNG